MCEIITTFDELDATAEQRQTTPLLIQWIQTNVTFVGGPATMHHERGMFLFHRENYHLGPYWPFMDLDHLRQHAKNPVPALE